MQVNNLFIYNEEHIKMAKEIAEDLAELCGDEFFYDEDDTEIYNGGALDTYLMDKFGYGNYKLNCGVTKAVLILDTLPFVIKWSFDGSSAFDWCNEDRTIEFYDEDYARAEYERYQDVCKNNPKNAHFFARTEFLDTFNDRNFYIQEKCIDLYSTGESPVKVSKKSLDRVIEKRRSERKTDGPECYSEMDQEWIARCLDLYSEEQYESLMNYLYDTNLNIDMHFGNYGYRLGSQEPVLIDFCEM